MKINNLARLRAVQSIAYRTAFAGFLEDCEIKKIVDEELYKAQQYINESKEEGKMEKHPYNLNKYQEAYAYILTVTNGADGFISRMNIMRELVELHTPTNPKEVAIHPHGDGENISFGKCPSCNSLVDDCDDIFCSQCGQKLDWITKKEEV